MRIPGTRHIEAWTVRTFELTPSDKRVVTRGVRDVKATAVGAASAFIATGGNPFADPKAAVAFVATSAVAAMVGKKTREQIGQNDTPPQGGNEDG